MTADARPSAENDAGTTKIAGHLVIGQSGRFKCLLCGAQLLSAMQFNAAECRGVGRGRARLAPPGVDQ